MRGKGNRVGKALRSALSSLVDPVLSTALLIYQLFRPKSQASLLLCTLYGITVMGNVPDNLEAKIPMDGPRLGVRRVGLPEHHLVCLHIQPLAGHGNHRP